MYFETSSVFSLVLDHLVLRGDWLSYCLTSLQYRNNAIYNVHVKYYRNPAGPDPTIDV